MNRSNRAVRRRYENDAETARIAKEVASRAVRRLDVLEWVILLGAAALSALAGALVGVLASHMLGLSFRVTWVVSSLLIFGVPAWFAMRREKREDAAFRERILKQSGRSDG
jgi:cytochrome c oxidase assembly factor CtaG